MKTRNPYLPSWEYVPDGEPHVFGDRLYVYGSHDRFGGCVFCLGDYVCWSCPTGDPGDWRYEGVIYPKTSDPLNADGSMCLYAPDVTRGPDGRYYLDYVLDHVSVVSVAVSDTPAGRYEFYGYVKHPDGTLLGNAPGDEPQFDPGVLTEGEVTYLYTGFCGFGDKSRHGAMATVLERDMLTVKEPPKIVVPGRMYAEGTGYEGHAFFEAPSIRKICQTYYFIYSSEKMHELCYATSDKPTEGFRYRGVLVSNGDVGIGSYKPADLPAAFTANNHGSIVNLGGEWKIFYHRHTNGTWYSRQGCAEPLTLREDGSFVQAEITSQGMDGRPIPAKGEIPAYLACCLYTEDKPGRFGDGCARITQDGRDGDEEEGYIARVGNGTVIGFKYLDCRGVTGLTVTTRGYLNGKFELKTAPDGEVLGAVEVHNANIWTPRSAPAAVEDGVHAVWLVFRGHGEGQVKAFELT